MAIWKRDSGSMTFSFNNPAAGKAGTTFQLAIGYHCPGLPEPGRWAP
jgi:hypothetical protein